MQVRNICSKATRTSMICRVIIGKKWLGVTNPSKRFITKDIWPAMIMSKLRSMERNASIKSISAIKCWLLGKFTRMPTITVRQRKQLLLPKWSITKMITINWTLGTARDICIDLLKPTPSHTGYRTLLRRPVICLRIDEPRQINGEDISSRFQRKNLFIPFLGESNEPDNIWVLESKELALNTALWVLELSWVYEGRIPSDWQENMEVWI